MKYGLRIVWLLMWGAAGWGWAEPVDLGGHPGALSPPTFQISGILLDESERPLGRIPLHCSAGEEAKLLDPKVFTEPDGSFHLLLHESGEYDLRLFSTAEVLGTVRVSEAEPAATNAMLRCAREAALDIAFWLHLDADSPHIAEVLQAGAQVDRTNYLGQTALMIAVENGYADAAQALLEAGAEVNAVDLEGATALHIACQRGDSDIVARLIAAGANWGATNREGRTPLDVAIWEGREEAAQLLRAQDAPGTVTESQAMGTIRGMVRDETGAPVARATVLCNRMGDEIRRWYGGMTDRDGGYRVERLPLGTYEVQVGHMPLDSEAHKTIVLSNRDEIVVGVDLRMPKNDDSDPKEEFSLHDAAAEASPRNLQHLLDTGAPVDATNRWEKTPLMEAARGGYLRNVECLLKAGADVNRRDHMGNTALHLACEKGHRNVAEILVEAGTDLAGTNYWGRTPLDEAVWENHPRLAEALRERGAPGTLAEPKPGGMIQGIVVDEDGVPLRNVVLQYHRQAGGTNDVGEHGEVRTEADGSFLLYGQKAGGYRFAAASRLDDPVVVCLTNDWDKQTQVRIQIPRRCVQEAALYQAVVEDDAQAAAQCLAEGADPHAVDCEGESLLEMAIGQWATNVVPVLLRHGVDINAPAADGITPLRRVVVHWLSWKIPYLLRMGAVASPAQGGSPLLLIDVTRRPLEVSANSWRNNPRFFSRGAKTARLLIQAGAPVNVSDEYGMTPLHHAAGNGYAECVRVLLNAGADAGATNAVGQTALDLAESGGHARIVEVLRKHPAGGSAVPRMPGGD